MAGGFSIPYSVANATDWGTVAGSSTGTTVGAGGTANTKGVYAQILASTPHDSSALIISMDKTTLSTEYAFDLAIGGSGSEQVILSNMLVQSLDAPPYDTIYLPMTIPVSTRLSMRAQCTTASLDVQFILIGLDGGQTSPMSPALYDTYGFVAASTHGTSVDPGATANTKGAWAQIAASTAADLCGLMIAVDGAGISSATANATVEMLLDIGVGAAGSEQVIVSNLQLMQQQLSGGANSAWPSFSPLIPVQVPAGSRLAARCQSTSNTATQRTIGVVLYGARV